MKWNLGGGRQAEILLVEDNEDDVVLTRLGFDRVAAPVRLHTVENGEECLKFLRRAAPYTDAPTPDLVLLDLNLPVLDGRATLAAMLADPSLPHVPVVVLTTSARDEDVAHAYRARCAGYVVKPTELTRFFEVVRTICEYWFGVVELPPAPH